MLFFFKDFLKYSEITLFVRIASLPPLKITAFPDLKHKVATSEVTFGLDSYITPITPIGTVYLLIAIPLGLFHFDIILNIHKKNNVTKFIKCSSSLKFCLIASGEFDIYAATARAKEWDIAAGHAIAEHAGAILTTFTGRKITYGKKNFTNPTMILKRSNNLLK